MRLVKLGVPAIKDRVAQAAAVLVLEPIFEADLQLEQYAYQSDRSALLRLVHSASFEETLEYLLICRQDPPSRCRTLR